MRDVAAMQSTKGMKVWEWKVWGYGVPQIQVTPLFLELLFGGGHILQLLLGGGHECTASNIYLYRNRSMN
jgi:hypothetical protein